MSKEPINKGGFYKPQIQGLQKIKSGVYSL